MRRKFDFSIGEYYHIYNRGTDKREIFSNTHDFNRFITLLYICNNTMPIDVNHLLQSGVLFKELIDIDIKEKLVDIGAYCLMPNHFHLLLREKQKNGISLFMKKLLTAYSMYFNKKYKRTGRLFEGPFLAKHVDTDEYLKYLLSYIHLNPVKIIDSAWKENGIKDKIVAKKYLSNYFYSSYLDYSGRERREKRILNLDAFPEYFSDLREFDDFINEWLSYSTEDSKNYI